MTVRIRLTPATRIRVIETFLQDDKAKQQRAMAALTKAMPDILALFKQASAGTA